jgi:hypothetical protein
MTSRTPIEHPIEQIAGPQEMGKETRIEPQQDQLERCPQPTAKADPGIIEARPRIADPSGYDEPASLPILMRYLGLLRSAEKVIDDSVQLQKRAFSSTRQNRSLAEYHQYSIIASACKVHRLQFWWTPSESPIHRLSVPSR